MTQIEEALRGRLIATTGVTDIVGTSNDARVYYGRLPEGANIPAIVYQRVSRVGFPTYAEATRLTQRRFQIDSWAETGQAASELAHEVRKSLDGFSGTQSGINVLAVFLLDEATMYDSEAEIYRIRQDYSISHIEST